MREMVSYNKRAARGEDEWNGLTCGAHPPMSEMLCAHPHVQPQEPTGALRRRAPVPCKETVLCNAQARKVRDHACKVPQLAERGPREWGWQ